ncbi:DUF294 nucleotidyltransferase-like domain-containing protein [Virgibacillus xinjiangensis]|uniref:DUF294 nucleotidyltransferase-like domain-containing protein n=1 Tax=Virgibacillus xinjiangensis TaxID=393090 RepID=A0ABV7CX90_9BACI
MENYREVRDWRQKHIGEVSTCHFKLNKFHDDLIKYTVLQAMEKVQREQGNPPVPFAFFLMGSAGRMEQSIWSDQDHGIVFDGKVEHAGYFQRLGSEIAVGLEVAGYQLCDGGVMASNPLWCQSVIDWEQQITDWLKEASWTSLRHFSTFMDARVLIGEQQLVMKIKKQASTIINSYPRLSLRLAENVDFIKKGIGFFGQLLSDSFGKQSGKVQLKQTAIFPYVNALRILAVKQGVPQSSTLSRFNGIKEEYPAIGSYEVYFVRLLQFRLRFQQEITSYEQVHLISVDRLTKEDRKELKTLMKKGYELFSNTKEIIEGECSAR